MAGTLRGLDSADAVHAPGDEVGRAKRRRGTIARSISAQIHARFIPRGVVVGHMAGHDRRLAASQVHDLTAHDGRRDDRAV